MIEHPGILFGVLPGAAYVIGSTPFGVLLARARGVNLRAVGSGNVGATNVARALGRTWGYLCFLLDVLKGLVPTLVVGWWICPGGQVPTLVQQAAWLAVGAGCIVGHVCSFWLRFRGGKGVATAMGVVLGVWPYFTAAGLCALALWVIVTLKSRYISLGSVVAAVAFLPLFVVWNLPVVMDLWPLGAFAAAMVLLIVVRHRTNLRRLWNGTENRIGSRKEQATE